MITVINLAMIQSRSDSKFKFELRSNDKSFQTLKLKCLSCGKYSFVNIGGEPTFFKKCLNALNYPKLWQTAPNFIISI